MITLYVCDNQVNQSLFSQLLNFYFKDFFFLDFLVRRVSLLLLLLFGKILKVLMSVRSSCLLTLSQTMLTIISIISLNYFST